MKKILKFLFPKTIEQIEIDAVEGYSRLSTNDLLNNAINGVSFYIRGNSRKDGKHKLYKFTPEDLGFNTTIMIRPGKKAKKVYWRGGKVV